MSRNYRFKDFLTRNKRGLSLFGLLSISSLLILFNGTPGVAKPQEIGLSVFSFFQGIVTGSVNWISQTFNSVDELRKLREEYEKAKTEIARYNGIERNLLELKQENKTLNELLKFSTQIEQPNIPASVIGKDPSNITGIIVVGKGYLDGIRKDMPVISYQNGLFGLVGKVLDVGLSSSTVLPILDSSNFVSARFQNSRYEGLVVGKGINDELLSMQFVKKRAQSDLKTGELVVTSGLNSLYPKGISIGRLKGIKARDYETSLDLELEPVITFSKLEYVYILVDKVNP